MTEGVLLPNVDHVLLGMFADDLLFAGTWEERFQIYERYLVGLGFAGATYTFVPPVYLESDCHISPVFAATQDYPLAFLKHYQEARFDLQDFTIRLGAGGFQGVIDWWDCKRHQQISVKESDVIIVAREEYGIRNGLSFISGNQRCGFHGSSLISRDEDASYDLLRQEKMGTLHRLVETFHTIIASDQQFTARFFLPFFSRLNEKELGVLRHIAQGRPLKQVEYSVDVGSSKVASNMLDNIRKKFGGITRERLMFLAGLYHMLEQA